VLTWKSKDWLWGTAEQQAFDVLKNAVTSAPMLTFPSRSGLFCLECDASNFAMGAILSQQHEDGLFHPIGFMSKSFSNMEQNYQIHDKEMLVIMHCHGMTSLLSFLVFVCAPSHLHHLPTPSDLICLPSAASTPTLRCTHATMLHLCSD